MKGRPSGTKKSSDPNVKRRKREKRELGLCDVKIKITEWFGREEAEALGMTAVALGEGDADFGAAGIVAGQEGLHVVMEHESPDDGEAVGKGEQMWPQGHPGADGKKWYTIQRVNGSADTGGRGKGGDDTEDDDMNGGEGGRNLDHKHTLHESDRIKKNSVQRWLLKEEKEKRSGKKVCLLPVLLNPNSILPLALFQLDSSRLLQSSPFYTYTSPVPTQLMFFPTVQN